MLDNFHHKRFGFAWVKNFYFLNLIRFPSNRCKFDNVIIFQVKFKWFNLIF